MTPQERAEQVVSDLPMIDLYPVTKYRLTEVIRVAIIEATNDEIEKRRAAETVIEILTQRLGYIASVAAPGEEDDRQPTLAEGEDKPPEPGQVIAIQDGEFHPGIINALQAVLNVAEHNPKYVVAILLRRAQAAIDAMRPTPNPARSIEHTDTTACDCWKCRNLRGQTD